MKSSNPAIRNIAIIAHVDHGKTTLVDAMLNQSGIFGSPRAARRARHGFQRARARARHHHPRQDHRRALPRRQDQHRRYARPQRFRRRGGARAQDRRWRHAAGGRQRRPAAADALRALEGARSPAAAHRGDQQDRPARRARAGGAQRDLRPVHRSRRHRGPARFPGALHRRQDRRGQANAWTTLRPTCARCSTPSSSTFPRRWAIPKPCCKCSSPTWITATTWAAWASAASSTAR